MKRLLAVFLLLGACGWGAVAGANLVANGDNTDATSYTTASITPTANYLVLAAILVFNATEPPVQPTVTGNGLTWVEVNTITFGTIAAPVRRLSVYRARGASPSAGAVTIDMGVQTNTGCLWSISEFSGADSSGTNGSGAIVQSTTNRLDSNTTITVTLAAFGSSNNATYGAFGWTGAGDLTVGSGFTELGEGDLAANPSSVISSEWRADNDTTIDMTYSGSATRNAGIAVEIKAASLGGYPVLQQQMKRRAWRH